MPLALPVRRKWRNSRRWHLAEPVAHNLNGACPCGLWAEPCRAPRRQPDFRLNINGVFFNFRSLAATADATQLPSLIGSSIRGLRRPPSL